MTQRLCLALAFAISISGVGSVRAQSMHAHATELVSVARAITRTDTSDSDKSAEVIAAYEKLIKYEISELALPRYTNEELALLFDTNDETVIVSRELRFARNMETLLGALRARNKSTSGQYEALYQSFIRVRDFERARKIAN